MSSDNAVTRISSLCEVTLNFCENFSDMPSPYMKTVELINSNVLTAGNKRVEKM